MARYVSNKYTAQNYISDLYVVDSDVAPTGPGSETGTIITTSTTTGTTRGGTKPGYVPGDNWVECDLSGLTFRQSECVRQWDGKVVAKIHHEPRHPQDFVRGRKDRIRPHGLVSPPTLDAFVDVTFVTDTENTTIPTATFG